jgi:hypothetical protein
VTWQAPILNLCLDENADSLRVHDGLTYGDDQNEKSYVRGLMQPPFPESSGASQNFGSRILGVGSDLVNHA